MGGKSKRPASPLSQQGLKSEFLAQPLTAPEEGSPNVAQIKPVLFLMSGHHYIQIYALT